VFSGLFFGAPFYGQNTRARDEKEEKRRRIYKPTGLPPYRETLTLRKTVDQRVEESREIHQEVTREVLRLPKPIRQMSLAEIEAEIGVRLRQKMDKEDEDLVFMLLAAAVAG